MCLHIIYTYFHTQTDDTLSLACLHDWQTIRLLIGSLGGTGVCTRDHLAMMYCDLNLNRKYQHEYKLFVEAPKVYCTNKV